LEDKENKLLQRREVKFEVRFEGATPARKDVKEALRSKLGVDANLVVIHALNQPFGIARVQGEAAVYKDEKSKAVEHAHLLRRDSGEKGKAKEVPKDTGKAAPAAKKK
jgi:small subunit ribosomal protein S24e